MDAVISLIGAIACTIISLMFPAIVYAKLNDLRIMHWVLVITIIAMGLIAEVYTIYFNIILLMFRTI